MARWWYLTHLTDTDTDTVPVAAVAVPIAAGNKSSFSIALTGFQFQPFIVDAAEVREEMQCCEYYIDVTA